MQKDDILEFLGKIDAHLQTKFPKRLSDGDKLSLRIFGKSALMLAGLQDSVGTVDIDILKVETLATDALAIDSLSAEFGRERKKVHGYYLEFVQEAMVFLPQKPNWIPLDKNFPCLTVEFLSPTHVAASKLFSAFSTFPRPKDKQDIRAALDQRLVAIQELATAADQIFDLLSMDARSDRFPSVHSFLVNELMPDYGGAKLKYVPEE
jgi:hypothetical protein